MDWLHILRRVGPLGKVNISMLCLICLRILQNAFPESALYSEWCHIYFWWSIYSATLPELYMCSYLYVCESYNGVCIDMFVHIIMVSVFLCLCMVYKITVGYNSSWYFVLYLSSAYVSPPLCHCYIFVCINLFVKVIYIFTANMFVYFIQYAPWLCYILGILSFIFTIYYCLFRCRHPFWPAFT